MSESPSSKHQSSQRPDINETESQQALTDQSHHRPLRSFVIRAGRLTTSQKEALDRYWSDYVIENTGERLNANEIFGRVAPLVVEIGFGMGDSLAEMAMANPDKDYIGIEVHRPGVGKLLNTIALNQITNLRIYCHDAVEILRDCVADHSLAGVQIFFPDPWHKKKHHKRRLIQPAFIEKLTAKLQPGGFIHLATDWEHYADHMLEVMQANPTLHNTAGPDIWASNTGRPETKFERRGHRLGHGVWDLVYTFNPPQP